MDSNPLMPGRFRLPMNPQSIAVGDEPPSAARPFILRGVTPRPSGALVDGVVRVKHRTPATQRTIPEKTGMDNTFVDDSYTVPDQ